MPVLGPASATEKPEQEPSNIISYNTRHECKDGSALWIGMVDRGQEPDLKVIQNYVNYLKNQGIVGFSGEIENGSVRYCTDIAGNDLVNITVALETAGDQLARTSLRFSPFFHKNTAKLSLVKK